MVESEVDTPLVEGAEEMVGSTIFFSCVGVTYVPLAVAQILSDTMRIGKSKRKAHSLFSFSLSPFWPALCLREPHSGQNRGTL